MIPFVRNLADYCGFEAESAILTSILHQKADSNGITISNLFDAYKKVLNGHEFTTELAPDTAVIPLLLGTTEQIDGAGEVALDLKKVIFSIAIRLFSERKVINDDEFVNSSTKNQTAKLLRKLKEVVGGNEAHALLIALLDRVNLMTPENIHLNSFMYEPILDMSAEHLARFHNELIAACAA